MCFPFFFFVHWFWPEGGFFAVGEGLSIYFARFSLFVHSFRWIAFVFFVSTLPSGYYASDSDS